MPWPSIPTKRKRGRPYVYSSTTVILRCFIVRLWFRIDSNTGLHTFFMDCQYNRKLAIACGLTIPSRCTFDRRLKTISTIDKKKGYQQWDICLLQSVWLWLILL
jgi:hypothetical protein